MKPILGPKADVRVVTATALVAPGASWQAGRSGEGESARLTRSAHKELPQ
jgi:hypothetical protein